MSVPSSPSSMAVRTYAMPICRRLPPIAFIMPISDVCSDTSVDIVLPIKNNPDTSASSVITVQQLAELAEELLARIVARLPHHRQVGEAREGRVRHAGTAAHLGDRLTGRRRTRCR